MDEYPGINSIRKHVHIYTENPENKDRAQNQHAGQTKVFTDSLVHLVAHTPARFRTQH